jgi:hypothetical protein
MRELRKAVPRDQSDNLTVTIAIVFRQSLVDALERLSREFKLLLKFRLLGE